MIEQRSIDRCRAPMHWQLKPRREPQILRRHMSSTPARLHSFLRFVPQVAGLLLIAYSVTGCGNNPHPPPLREKRDDGSPWLVRYGAMNEEARSLDPQVAYDQMSRTVLEPVYDTLLEYHPMKTDPYEVVPCLLEAMPER